MKHDPISSSPRRDAICALALMAKVPFAGPVKTRLTPPLSPEEAATLSTCFLRDMTTNVLGMNGDGTEGVVLYTPSNAEAELLSNGFESLCLINSDSPTLPGEILRAAASLLAQDGDRVVLGPSEDGGYYLIGLKHPHHELFERIAWSTADVLAHTIERAGEINLPVEFLPTWYDVDDAATLRLLCDELSLLTDGHDCQAQFRGGFEAPHTRKYLAGLIAKDDQRLMADPHTAKTRA